MLGDGCSSSIRTGSSCISRPQKIALDHASFTLEVSVLVVWLRLATSSLSRQSRRGTVIVALHKLIDDDPTQDESPKHSANPSFPLPVSNSPFEAARGMR